MKVVNGRKFLRSIGLIIGLVLFFSLLINSENIALSHQEVSYKEIYVSSGDTLWSLAKEEAQDNLYYNNKDVRYIITDIKNINNLKNSELSIGQKLVIPNL